MADADLRALGRRWHEEGSVEAARDFVAARLRLGALGATASPGTLRAAEEAFLEGLARRDPVLTRTGLSALDVDGQPEGDRWRPQDHRGVVISERAKPCALRWPGNEDTIGPRLVAGWLETLTREARLALWTIDVLSEPAVTDVERRALFASLAEPGAWNVQLEALSAVVQVHTTAVCYVASRYLEGGPPAITRSIPRLVHGLLRCGLVRHARERDDDAADIVCAVLERPESHEPSRPELRLSADQIFGIWERRGADDPRALEVVTSQLREAYALRGALGAAAAIPSLLTRPRVVASITRLVGQVAREPIGFAVACHLAPVLDGLPETLALDLLLRARDAERWSVAASVPLADALFQRGEGWPAALRRAAEETLLAIAARGEAEDVLVPAIGQVVRFDERAYLVLEVPPVRPGPLGHQARPSHPPGPGRVTEPERAGPPRHPVGGRRTTWPPWLRRRPRAAGRRSRAWCARDAPDRPDRLVAANPPAAPPSRGSRRGR